VNSFRWLFLIHALTGRSFGCDDELEQTKVFYVLSAYRDFVVSFRPEIPNAVPFATAVFCAITRLITLTNIIPDFLFSSPLYTAVLPLLTLSDSAHPVIALQDFLKPDLFLFGCPVPLDSLNASNLFADPILLLRTSILLF
jgi:hypothetical protein